MRTCLIILFSLWLSAAAQMTNAYIFKDGTGTTLTDVKGSANGTLGGASLPVWSTNGYLSFTGGHGSTFGNYNRVDVTRTTFEYGYLSTFTLMSVFRSTKADANYHIIFSTYNAAELYYELSQQIAPDEANRTILTASSGASTKYNQATTALCNGGWHVVIMIYNGSTLVVYVDGKSVAITVVGSLNSNFYSANSKMVFGAAYKSSTTNYGYDLTGDICRIINWNGTALTVSAIQDINNEFNLLY